MDRIAGRNFILVAALALLLAPSAIAADRPASATSAAPASGKAVGPSSGNIDTATKQTQPQGQGTDKAAPTGSTKAQPDSPAEGSTNPELGIKDAANPVTEETRNADTNNDGRATDAELDNAANGGDIHSMHR